MKGIHLDFETRSDIDLLKTTTEVYAKGDNTDIWCMAFAKDKDVYLETNYADIKKNSPLDKTINHVRNNGIIIAHNAQFEWTLWNEILVKRYGFPYLKIENCVCTMAMAYAMGLPGSLEKAAAAAGIEQRKDTKGARLMKQMAKPKSIENGKIIWWDDEERRHNLYAYCKQDVVVERELSKRLRPLSSDEQKLWVLDQQINARGIYVDIAAVNAVDGVVDEIKKDYDAHMNDITDGYVFKCTNSISIREYLRDQGVETKGVAKDDLKNLLETDISDHVKDVIETRRESSKTSNAKLKTIKLAISSDNRLRNLFQYYAAITGRWGGRKVQPHNLPRPYISQDEIEYILESSNLGDPEFIKMLYDKPLDAFSYCIRGMLTAAPGKKLVCLDFKSVEAIVLAMLTNEKKVLTSFDSGRCLYKAEATGIYGVEYEDVTPEQRQIGKVSVLALGYQGGIGAFQSMAKVYGVKMSDKQADEIKENYRENNKNIKRFWNTIEKAAIQAALNKGTAYKAGRYIKFLCKGSFLYCKLPSGRLMLYPYPKIIEKETPWGEMKRALAYKTVDKYKWKEVDTYGGKLTENVTQAVARDLLANSMINIDKAGYEIVMHVHDEVVVEVDENLDCYDDIEKIFLKVPKWFGGIPLKADGWQGKMYRK